MSRRIFDDELHAHFVTFSCHKRRKLLGPDRAKRIVIGTLAVSLQKYGGMCCGFVVMLDHVHALVWFDRPNQLSAFMDRWKSDSSHRIKALYRAEHAEYWQKAGEDAQVWTPRYYPFNVYSGAKFQEKLEYMHVNPVKKQLVSKACDWPWSSARWYIEGKSV